MSMPKSTSVPESTSVPKSANRSAAPLFVMLLGTLTFSLSSPSGHSHDLAMRSLSSEVADVTSDCDQLVDTLDNNAALKTGKCEVRSRDFVGRVKLEQRTFGHRDDQDHVTTTPGWQYTLEVVYKDPKNSGESGNLTKPVRGKLSSFRDITAAINDEFPKAAREAQKKLKEDKQLKEDIANCVRDEDSPHDDIAEGKDRDLCFVERMKEMEPEEAAIYYEDKVQAHLEGLLTAKDAKQQREGKNLLKALEKAKAGGSFVKEAVTDLRNYTDTREALKQEGTYVLTMQNDILNTPAGALRNQKIAALGALMNKMGLQQRMMDNAFSTLKTKRGDEDLPPALTNPYAVNALVENLDSYQASLDELYKNVIHNDAIPVTPAGAAALAAPNGNGNGVIQNGDPRTDSRGGGTPVTSLARPTAVSSTVNTGIPRLNAPVGRR